MNKTNERSMFLGVDSADRKKTEHQTMVAFSAIALIFFVSLYQESFAAQGFFAGLTTFNAVVLSLIGTAVVIGIVALLISGLSQGNVQWGIILFALLGIVFVGIIASDIGGFLGLFGINLAAAGLSYGQVY